MFFDSESQFYVWEPVIYKAEYTVDGDSGTVYKALLKFRGFGKKLLFKRKVKPGTYVEIWTLLVPGRLEDDATITKTHVLKGKLRTPGVSGPDGLIMVTEKETVPIYIIP
jgi:hypothetical protein